MRRLVWCLALGVVLVPAVAPAQTTDLDKQIVVVQGGVTAPPPPTVVVGVEPVPPPTVVVTPVPVQPVQPTYVVQPATVQQPVYYAEPPPVEETSNYNFVISLNPLLFWFGGLNFEVALADWFALDAQLDFMYLGMDDWGFYSVGIFAGPTFYPGGSAPQGFFLGPRVGFDHFGVTSSDANVEIVRAGALLGYEWIWGGFAFAIGGGGAWMQVVGGDDEEDLFLFNMFIPFFDLRIGWAI
jgi:hypothetical protein